MTGLADDQRILQRLAGIGGSILARAERKPPPTQVGPYEILKPLAEGGMGAVYTARHVHLGKIVALKLLSTERVADALSVARFIQEMKALGQLNHPNIVQAHVRRRWASRSCAIYSPLGLEWTPFKPSPLLSSPTSRLPVWNLR